MMISPKTTTKQQWTGDAESIIKNFIVYQFSAWPNTILLTLLQLFVNLAFSSQN